LKASEIDTDFIDFSFSLSENYWRVKYSMFYGIDFKVYNN